MRRAGRVLCAAWLVQAAPYGQVSAQTREQPRLILAITGGLTTASGLWSVPRQPVLAPSGARDTLGLQRRLRPAFSALLGAMLFRSPHLGYTLEAGLLGLGSESRCTPPPVFAPDADRVNEQACDDIQGRHIATNAVAFQFGLAWRLNPHAITQPYVRAAGGIAILGSSLVQTAARVLTTGGGGRKTQALLFIFNESRREELTLTATLAVGSTVALGPGYQFRVEVRDAMIVLPYVTGPAPLQTSSEIPVAPVRHKLVHLPTITVGLDVVLERRRTRRY